MTAQDRIEHPVTRLSAISDPPTIVALQERILSVPVPVDVTDYILTLVGETRRDPRLSLGASPRASMALYKGSQAMALLKRRQAATADDVRELAHSVLLKRISVKPEQQLRGCTEEKVIDEILTRIPMPEPGAARVSA